MTNKVAVTSGAFLRGFHSICKRLEQESFTIKDKKQLKDCHLIIFSGGSDINPEIYGQNNVASYISQYSIARDMLEIDFLKAAIESGKKILGICRGHQLINAVLGGQLVQEIRDIQDHPANHPIHDKGGVVERFFSKVNSLHHQGVVEPGSGLLPTSRYGGVIESTENDQIISVQWHPEAMWNQEAYDFFQYVLLDWAKQRS